MAEWGEREPDVPAIGLSDQGDAADRTDTATDETRAWPKWAQTFLDLFATSGNVMLSARGAGVNRQTPYQLRGRDEAFAAAWEEADEAATQTLEAEAWKRARSGSDRLLLFLLQARRPQTYRTNARVELAGDGGGPIQTMVVPEGLNDHERAALRQAIDAELARRGAAVEG